MLSIFAIFAFILTTSLLIAANAFQNHYGSDGKIGYNYILNGTQVLSINRCVLNISAPVDTQYKFSLDLRGFQYCNCSSRTFIVIENENKNENILKVVKILIDDVFVAYYEVDLNLKSNKVTPTVYFYNNVHLEYKKQSHKTSFIAKHPKLHGTFLVSIIENTGGGAFLIDALNSSVTAVRQPIAETEDEATKDESTGYSSRKKRSHNMQVLKLHQLSKLMESGLNLTRMYFKLKDSFLINAKFIVKFVPNGILVSIGKLVGTDDVRKKLMSDNVDCIGFCVKGSLKMIPGENKWSLFDTQRMLVLLEIYDTKKIIIKQPVFGLKHSKIAMLINLGFRNITLHMNKMNVSNVRVGYEMQSPDPTTKND